MRSVHSDLPFIARETELAALQEDYQGPHSAFWPIYGRRRVGKSELILQFGKNHPTLYLVGKRAPADRMMREFLEGAAIFLEEPLLASMPVESWKKTIEAVVQRWGKKDKLILVFDEFQWLVEKSPELPSVLQNIEHVILGEQAALYREPDFLLREELREVEKYYMILMALAGGALPSRDIARRAGIGDRSLHYYLDQLASLGYIDKHFPLTSQRPKVREVRYRLLDPFLRFWFRFIYPHTSLIAQVGAHRAVTQIIQPELEAYFGLCFESLCREALPLLYGKESVSALYEVGSYWDSQVQIDVVGLRRDGWIDLGECKWGIVKSLVSAAVELEEKVRHYPNAEDATIGRRLFVQSLKGHRKKKPENVRIHTLDELYE